MSLREIESAGGVVVNASGEVLVVNQHHDSWSLPKGKIERGEDALSAARREIEEESGIKDLILVKPLSSYRRFRIGKGGMGEDKTELKIIHMFLFRTSDKALAPSNPDNPEARWVSREKVADLLSHPKDKEYFHGILFELENLRG